MRVVLVVLRLVVGLVVVVTAVPAILAIFGSLLAPLDYSGLVWAALLGFLLWGDIPGTFVWVGAAIIVTAGIYIVRREAMLRRRGKPRGS